MLFCAVILQMQKSEKVDGMYRLQRAPDLIRYSHPCLSLFHSLTPILYRKN